MKPIFICLGLSLTMAPELTYAKKKKSTVGELFKRLEKKSQKIETKRSRTLVPKSDSPKFSKRKVNLSVIKPPSSSSFNVRRSSAEEKELMRVTDESIKQLYTLTRRFNKSSKRGELWLRLAELYSEKARLIEYQIQSDYDERVKDFLAGKLKRRPKLNLKPAQNYNKKGIQLYKWFIRDYPKDEKMPQALFYLGYNYFELLNEKEGLKYYKRLSKEFPRSKFVNESNFALGEYYFENEKWNEALPYYKKVARTRRSRLYSFALYKLAWCQYKLGQTRKALTSLERVIKVGRKTKGRGDSSLGGLSRIRLAEESIKDLVIFYGESELTGNPADYFLRVSGRKSMDKMLERLGYYYLDTGERDKARRIFLSLVEKDPYSPKAYDYQYQIVSMYGSAGDDDKFRQEAFRWIDKYGPSSVWAKRNAANGRLLKKANVLMESTLRSYVLQKHQTAQNSKVANARDLADKGYSLYFSTFKQSKNLAQMHFFYAELLFDAKKYKQAAEHYLWVIDNAENSQYAEKSLFNALLALDKGLPSDKEMKKIVGESRRKVPFDRTIKTFIRTSERYLKVYPDAKNRTQIIYRVGNLYYFYNHFEEAEKKFYEVIEKDRKGSKYSIWSAESLLSMYELKKDYVGLVKAVDRLLSYPTISNSRLAPKIRKIRENSQFIQAKNMEGDKGVGESAKAFEKIAASNMGSDLGVKAAFNAAVNYSKASNVPKAFALFAQVFRSKKSSPKNKQVALQYLAESSAQIGKYKEAAEYYELYVKKYPKDSKSVEFIYNAALIREGILYYTAAIKNYELYLRKSRSKDKHMVFYRMGRIWERRKKKGNFKKAIKYYKDFFYSPSRDLPTKVETAFRMGRIYEWMKDTSKAAFWYNRTVQTEKKTRRNLVAKGYAAEAKFKLVYKHYTNFRAIKIGLRNMQSALKKKIALKGRLEKELVNVIRYDHGGMVVASLTLQGQAEQHMAASIVKAPIPPGLNKEESKKYREQVAKIADPYSKAAINYYQQAIEKGKKLQGYNDWLLVAHKEMDKLVPNDNPAKAFTVFKTELIDWKGL